MSKFSLIIRKRVTSNYSGPRKSTAFGRGMVFKDHRIYSPGDDFRAIDWKVYARTDELMMKNYEEERSLTVHVLVDKSRSMGFARKFDYASMLGVGYAYLGMKSNDKVQFATFSENIDAYQPKRGMSQVMAMIDYLNSIKPSGKTDMRSLGRKYRHSIGSRSLIVVISDFFSSIDDIKETIMHLGHADASFIQVVSRNEKEPFFEGNFKFQDSESGETMRTYFSIRDKEEYVKRMRQHTEEIEHECSIKGINFAQVDTSMPIFDSFYAVLGSKQLKI
ncbi:DUF58 domain-containing protein [Candidatus Woesearchaeota archaeon]|nr:DUF58 domain-containing protein [Candidatus Woesearchaeota archaeon]